MPGKNEAKRAAAAALADLDAEMTEEERERMLRKGMGVDMGGALQKGEERLAERKLTKEEKKAQTEARRAALAEKKAQMAAMKEAIAQNRQGDEGEEGADGDAEAAGSSGYAQNYAEESGEAGDGAAVDVSDAAAVPEAAKPKSSKEKAKGSKAAAKKGGKPAEAASSSKRSSCCRTVQGVRCYSDDMPFFERSGPTAAKRKSMDMNIRIGGIRMCAGKQELLDSAVLALNFGVKCNGPSALRPWLVRPPLQPHARRARPTCVALRAAADGLVGRNGVGKTTLLRHLAEGLIPLPKFLNVVHVEQEIAGDDRTALQTILQADEEREWLLAVETLLCEGDDSLEKELNITLGEVYERLEEIDSDNAPARAAQLLSGLGFDVGMQNKKTKEYSGGWRMRIALAQALFLKPDLLLLDEPTNHLDVHALTWLEFFLAGWERTVLIVSHDRGFLNKVTTATMFIHGKRLRYYGGNYDTFLKVRAEHRAMNSAQQKQNDRRVNHLKSFIARFGHGAKNLAKQAQSRMKMLQKIQDEPCEVDFDDPYLKLDFPSASTLPPPCVSVTNVAFGYEPGARARPRVHTPTRGRALLLTRRDAAPCARHRHREDALPQLQLWGRLRQPRGHRRPQRRGQIDVPQAAHGRDRPDRRPRALLSGRKLQTDPRRPASLTALFAVCARLPPIRSAVTPS
jgi:ABC-type multidrug transport system ATPase subunit